MKLRSWLLSLLLLGAAGVVHAQPAPTQHPIICQAPSTICTLTGPTGTGTGDKPYQMSGKVNLDIYAFYSMYGLTSQLYLTGKVSYTDLVGLWSGTPATNECLGSLGSLVVCGGSTGTGTVTSVALAVPNWYIVSGSPVTTNGTLTIGLATGLTANEFLATPNGTAGTLGLRTIQDADIPSISLVTTGNGGVQASGTANQLYTSNGGSVAPSWVSGVPITSLTADSAPGGSDLFPIYSQGGGATESITLNKLFGYNVSGGTTFTITSGCTSTLLTGGATAGSFKASSSTCNPVFALPTANNGWVCGVQDETTAAASFRQSGHSTTSATMAGTSVAANDIIVFHCTGF